MELYNSLKLNKKSRDYKRLLFLSKQLMMNMWNQGSKENRRVKFKEGICICVKLCLKFWFESGWFFCNINNSGWFWKWLSRKKVLNNHFLKSLQRQPYMVRRSVKSNNFFEHKIIFLCSIILFLSTWNTFLCSINLFLFDVKQFFVQHQLFFVWCKTIFRATSTCFCLHQITFCATSNFLFRNIIVFGATPNFCFGHCLEYCVMMIYLLSRSNKNIITGQRKIKFHFLCDTKK